MTSLVRRWKWIFLGFVVVAALLWPSIRLKDSTSRLSSLPMEGTGFVTKDLELSDQEKEFLGEAAAVQRLVVTDEGSRMILNVIDGTHNRHAVHDPKYCFAGEGWTIESTEPIDLARGQALFLQLKRGHESGNALCFFDNGESQFSSSMSYWIKSSLRRITLGASGDEPVLVILRSLPGEPFSLERVRQVVLPGLGFQ